VLGAVSFAHEDTRTPMLAALAGLATAIAGALSLFPHYGHVGIAAVIAGSGWVGAATLALVLARWRRLHFDRAVRRRLPLIGLATLAMAGALVALRRAREPWFTADAPGILRLGALAILVAGGLLVYAGLLQVLRVARIGDLIAAARERI
jgi:putative peptidoglycan lipid II flippase